MDYRLAFVFVGCLIIGGCGSKPDIEADAEIEYGYQVRAVEPYGYETIAEQNRYRSGFVGQTESSKTLITAPAQIHPVTRLAIKPATGIDINRQIDLNFLSEDTTFRQSIEGIRNSTPGGLNIVVLWRDMERVGIEEDTPVRMDPIPSASLKTALKLVIESVSGGYDMIDYKITDDVIVIATNETLARFEAETRVYDITDLSQLPAEYRIRSSGSSGSSDLSGVSNR
ncbi:MAG: hypothetical protein JW837_12155 [Sedimentisphaerales bacterium]|nr:hypothetical protein [Sedimentisphaerales bacterium]